jgi:asparagine synthetase B (glutamine-hydrolysing)
LSGGIDSGAIMAGAIKRGLVADGFTLVMPGIPGEKQTVRINRMINKFNFRNYFSPGWGQGWMSTGHPYLELYYEATCKLAEKAAEQGVDIILTGFGGDELGKNDIEGRKMKEMEIELPRYITKKAAEDWNKLPKVDPPFLTRVGSLGEALSMYANIWLDSGIWVENVFSDMELWQITMNMKREWLVEKKLLQTYLAKQGWEEYLSDIKENANFREVYTWEMERYIKQYLGKLMDRSALAEWGLIDKHEVLELRNRTAVNNDIEMRYLMGLVPMEMFLQEYRLRKALTLED